MVPTSILSSLNVFPFKPTNKKGTAHKNIFMCLRICVLLLEAYVVFERPDTFDRVDEIKNNWNNCASSHQQALGPTQAFQRLVA